jgi:hypothetical protein
MVFGIDYQMKYEFKKGRKCYFCPAKSCKGNTCVTNISRHLKRQHSNDPNYNDWLKLISGRLVTSKLGSVCQLCDMRIKGQ